MNSMNRDEIVSLWFQSDKQLRKVAVQTVITHLPASWDICLDLLTDCPCEQLGELVGPLRGSMPFLKTGFQDVNSCTEGHYDLFKNMHQAYLDLIKTLAKRKSPTLLKMCYELFDGIRPDMRHLFPDIDFTKCQRSNEKHSYGHQLMIFVTGICNLHCSYCFSNNLEHRSISAEDLRRIFTWARKNGCTMITPCGGEPLIYPHIGLFLDLVAESGMTTYFATNATIPLLHFNKQQIGAIDLLTMHMTRSLWENLEYMRIFCENIELAQKQGIDIIARCNITCPDVDVTSWFELMDRYQLRRMNIALTIPSSLHNNNFVSTKLFTDYIPVIRQCIEHCQERSINLSFAKPIPPCIFDEETAEWLLQYDNFAPVCNIYEDKGTRNICLSPDLKFTPCLGVPTPTMDFNELLNWDDLTDTMGKEINGSLQKPLFERCHGCFLFDRKLCQGTCLSYKYLAKA